MNMHRATHVDRILPELFVELADARTPAYLEAAIERASSGPQRPSWTFPGRWLPIDITTRIAPVARVAWRQLAILALIGILVTLAAVAYVASQQRRLPAPFGPAANGVIALAKDGDIFVVDRPGGDLRLLVAGPWDDRSPIFSPDGTRLAFVRAADPEVLMVADPDGTNAVQLPMRDFDSTRGWSFTPDGRSLMTVAQIGGEKRVVIRPIDPAAGLTVLDIRLPDGWQEIDDPKFRPTNPQEILVVAQLEPDYAGSAVGPRGLYVYDLATGGIRTIVEPAPADEKYVHDASWLADGEHIIYKLFGAPRVVAADGSGDQAFDAVRGGVSSLSNDGTRIVAERDGEGEQTGRPVIVPINGDGESVVLACVPVRSNGPVLQSRDPGTDIDCPATPTDWIWSPDDSMLIAKVYHETSSVETPLAETYLLVDPNTGQVTELDWVDVGTPAWQRVAP